MTAATFRVAGAICLRTWRATARRPVTLSFSLVQPLIWVLFFGFLFQRYDVRSLTRGGRYLDFLVPGVCAMTVLFGASQSGIGLIRDLQTGFLKRILASPASTFAVLGGKLLADVLRLLAQALFVLLVARALGASVVLTPATALQTFAFLAVFAVSHASLSCMVALWTRAQESMATFVHLVNMPLLFTSSALVPVRHMPDWLASLSRGNPLTLAVDGCRSALLRGEPFTRGPSFVVLALLALVLFALAGASARRLRSVG
jgi:ABC-2 type transport system permease protein